MFALRDAIVGRAHERAEADGQYARYHRERDHVVGLECRLAAVQHGDRREASYLDPSMRTIDWLERAEGVRQTLVRLRAAPRSWLVTGGAGFIGSHLVETLLALGQRVTVLDDLSTGFRSNLDEVRGSGEGFAELKVLEGDVRDPAAVREAMAGSDVVLHHAAQVSVPRSVADPIDNHSVNVGGTLRVLDAARGAGARVVLAGSSASYGDDTADVKREERLGSPLSPYAESKTVGEQALRAFHLGFGLETVALRYFNVFGPRQDPNGPYAAVIPAWITNATAGHPCRIDGDGEQTRDFCHVANVVAVNLLAATLPAERVAGRAFNVGTGERTSLLTLHETIVAAVREAGGAPQPPQFAPARPGDVRHSCADVTLAAEVLGFRPIVGLPEGIRALVADEGARRGA